MEIVRKQNLEKVLRHGFQILAIIIKQFTIKVGMEGMRLMGVPKSVDVTSVTIGYKYLLNLNIKEIIDRDENKTYVHLNGFLKYKPFANIEVTTGTEGPAVTFYYHLENGEQVEVTGTNY